MALGITKLFKTIKVAFKFSSGIRKHCRPTKRFDEKIIPEGRDYSDIHSWAAHPEKSHKASLRPEDVEASSDLPADVFFIHPTTYFGKHNWNQTIGAMPSTEIVDEVIMPGQASVFNGACRIFAPYYRQATFYSFLAIRKSSARKALELAYSDIVKAFDYFIDNLNNGRPFVLAGHSQGTLMLIKLLEDRIENNPQLRSRFIAAYAIGFQFPKEKFGTTLNNIHICQSPTDSGCVIAYDTFGDPGGPSHGLDRAEIWHEGGWRRRSHHPVVGTNPLTWNSDTVRVSAEKNLGGVHTVYKGKGYSVDEWFGTTQIGLNATSLSKPYPEVVEAEVKEDGFLFINVPKPKIFNIALLPGYNYHNYDYALFHMNLRKNVVDRVQAFVG